jgi:hypothetical protein
LDPLTPRNSFHLTRATRLNPPNSQSAQVTPPTSLQMVPLLSTSPFLYASRVIRSIVCCVFSLPTFPCLAFAIQPLALKPVVANVVHYSNNFHWGMTHVRTCQSPKSFNPVGHLLHGSGHGYAASGTVQAWTNHRDLRKTKWAWKNYINRGRKTMQSSRCCNPQETWNISNSDWFACWHQNIPEPLLEILVLDAFGLHTQGVWNSLGAFMLIALLDLPPKRIEETA